MNPTKQSQCVKTLRLRIKDKHAQELRALACEVNFVWNYVNDLSLKMLQREGKFVSAYDLAPYTKGAGKEGLNLHSQTVQYITETYVKSRKQAKARRLRWRTSFGVRRNLGWIPFKTSALSYKQGQVRLSGMTRALSLWDSFGLSHYDLGSGSICEDSRGRWYLNVCVVVPERMGPPQKKLKIAPPVGIDLGLKSLAAMSTGTTIDIQQFFRLAEPKIASAQRANKAARVAALHAKVKNQRKDFAHKLSTQLVRNHCAIAVGNVNASALATVMGKSVLDAGWSQFRTMLMVKSDYAATRYLEVNEAYTTQECHVCAARSGPKGREELDVRRWTCPTCLTEHDRDTNAAKNILARAMRQWASEDTSEDGSATGMSVPSVVNKEPTILVDSPLGHKRLAVGIPFP